MQNSVVGQPPIPQAVTSTYNKPAVQQPAAQPAPHQAVQPQAAVQQNYATPPAVSPTPAPACQQIYPQAPANYNIAPQQQSVQVPNYSGVNIQIFNPSVTPPGGMAPVYNVNAPSYQTGAPPQSYPANYYTQQLAKPAEDTTKNITNTTNNTTNNIDNSKKTEKRKIVQLTDDYIKNLENYLNSQDKELRYMGAKEVIARLEEDESRKDDKALNALINKMLQDPYSKVRFLAMAALQSRMATGDNLTVQLLTNMQNSSSGYGQDSLMASDILLKMAGQTVEKEFEVKNDKKADKTTSDKK